MACDRGAGDNYKQLRFGYSINQMDGKRVRLCVCRQ